MKLNMRSLAVSAGSLVLIGFLAGSVRTGAAESASEKETKLIEVLQSDAPPGEKAITCKKLAIYGSGKAVPALAPLLANPDLASWARTALEAIPDPAVDDALRQAVGTLQGRLLIGTINSIGVRRDPKAVEPLVAKLKDADPEIVSTAAAALGRIGGDQAAQALQAALPEAAEGARATVAQGCVLCAEKYLAEKQLPQAVALYDFVRKATVPKQRMLEATRGAILARGSEGIPLLLEQLRSADKAVLGIGLRTARELPGEDVTRALASEVTQAPAERQAVLVMAVADRTDAAVLPAVLAAAISNSRPLRIAAVGALERIGNVSCLPVLLTAAASTDTVLAQTAKATLARLSGADIDAQLLAELPKASGKTRQALVELLGQRQIEGALPAILKCTQDPDAGVRAAAVHMVGEIGTAQETDDLVALLGKTQNRKERSDIEKALMAVSSRAGAACTPQLLTLAKSDDSAMRIVALHTLACVGGADALAAVKSALTDQETGVQDEAARTLSTWPNNWPEDEGVAEPLLNLAKSSPKVSHQVLGFRGYLDYVQGNKNLKDDAKIIKIKELLPLMNRPEEKRLAISVAGAIPSASSLELLTSLTEDSNTAEEACSAIVALASKKMPAASVEVRRKALEAVIDKSKNDATKSKAQELLSKAK
jgi:HEAT repeat protein